MASNTLIPETHVLAIASHTDGHSRYVGNKMASFVMQSLGCDVSAINTVHYSNHTAYKQVKGTKTTAQQIQELYEGLKQSSLNNFDLLLTGYVPSAEAVQAVGKIGRDLKFNAATKPGSFFWVLDPVMGDNGQLYIPEDEVPQYKALLREADLILPNQFEAETLSDIAITDLNSLAAAIQVLHKTYQVPHVIITSLRLTPDNQTIPSRTPVTPLGPLEQNADADISPPSTPTPSSKSQFNPPPSSQNLTIIGSTATSTHTPRLFRIDTPQLPLFFSGTGDMFAALTIPRLIEAVHASPTPNLHSLPSWRSPDDVPAEELPLAKACQKVLASMQSILTKTTEKCEREMKRYDEQVEKEGCGVGQEAEKEREMRRHLALMKASEVVVVRHIRELVEPPELERFRPRRVEEGRMVDKDTGAGAPDELGAVKLGIGRVREGAVQVVGGKGV
ncbi:Ribokinase-like protein [Lindgomyces ingoldianus]|uniref:Ribokinase-like protein n=1 Tax=Lindgomyces ingoldianus TaxID=673940 RepID=A0ACB6QDL0_9PLEO|nr:Ribokinase-like protein [Lindgomyces ingoldianus]KAF2465048.1 Ribokinase-like protein [Lindgomyces ingoldianus]